ncbi:MAG: peptidase M50 [Melioribacteraceae bacterium]|nr:MAG: peptidase M50 [Melioribacteraceae bacterium]
MDKFADGLTWYIIFLFSTTLHEASHAFISYKFGDRTAYEGGQVSLNPVPHVKREPFGTVVVPILSFLLGGWMIGWASAPYNVNWAMTYPKKSAAMALGGPLANLSILLLCAIVIRLGISSDIFYAPDSINVSTITRAYEGGIYAAMAKFLSIGFSLNLILFTFNLLPIPPLDGSAIIKFFMPDEFARKYMNFVYQPGIGIIGILVAWNLFDHIYFKALLFFINLLYPENHYE